jgi:predicted RNase H-like nuclease
MIEALPKLEPSLKLTHDSLPSIPEKGREMKAVEDQLDSIICAYSAAHWWYWGLERNWVLGDRTTGYIVIPTPFGRKEHPA